MPKKMGASRNRLPTPDSQPNASQITNAVLIGHDRRRQHARPEQPDREQRGGELAGDRLQGAAPRPPPMVTVARARKIVAAVATTMKTAITLVHDRPADRVGLLEAQLLLVDRLLGDGRLCR